MSLSLAAPWGLGLLVPGAVVAVTLRRRLPGTGRRQRWWMALEGCAVGLLILSLAQPQLARGARSPVVLALDRSATVDRRMTGIERAWAGAARARCQRPCRVVQFARTAAVIPDQSGSLAARRPVGRAAGATDLERGVAAAIALAPAGGRVVVLADGTQTAGNVLATAPLARRRGVRIDYVPLADPARRDAAVTEVDAPAAVHAGDPLPLPITIRSTVAAPATLELARDGTPIGSVRVTLHVGDTPLVLGLTAGRPGWERITVRVRLAGDAVPVNDALTAVTRVLAPPRALVVGAGGRSPGTIATMLARAGLTATVVAPGRLPVTAGGYAAVDAVVLDDLPAADLPPAQVRALGQAVRTAGLGLLVLGGPHSFSLGGYAGSALGPLLPVASTVPAAAQRKGVAIELVLDHSGSMAELTGGVPEIDLVRSAAAATARFAAAHRDDLGIVDFDVAAHLLVPIEALAPGAVERAVLARIGTLQANGGTNIYAGLLAGARQVVESTAPTRRIILMTDGISQPESYRPLLVALRRAHVPVATVALGPGADTQLLGTIARATGGHAYATDSARQLPRIFGLEARLALKPVSVVGRVAVAVGRDSPVLGSLSGTRLPVLGGNVLTQLRPGAQADLVATGIGGGLAPALAQWQVGLGRVLAWTPGLDSPWAGAWAGRTALWAGAVRWVDRPAGLDRVRPQVVPGSPPALRLDLAAGGDPIGPTAITGSLTAGGRMRRVDFLPVGPGLYRAALAPLAAGAYRYQLDSGGVQRLAASGWVAIPYPSEFRPGPARDSPLDQLAVRTGGSVLAAGDLAALAAGGRQPLWWPLALAALALFAVGAFGRLLRRPVVGPRPTAGGAPPARGSARRSARRGAAAVHGGDHRVQGLGGQGREHEVGPADGEGIGGGAGHRDAEAAGRDRRGDPVR